MDPELAGGLREWLEDELASVVAAIPTSRRPIRIGAAQINGSGALRGDDAALGRLVPCLFRQWVTTGSFGDPLTDALAGESALGDPAGTVEAVSRLPEDVRRLLSADVSSHAQRIRNTWPVLSPSWHPRTRERLIVPLCGGGLVLGGTIDLIVGPQAVSEATKCMVEVSATDSQSERQTEHQTAHLHFYALLETMRAGAAPSRVATYHTGDGVLSVEPVDEHMLVGALLRTIDIARRSCALRVRDQHNVEEHCAGELSAGQHCVGAKKDGKSDWGVPA